MASTVKVLTSLHGRLLGLSATKRLIAFGRTVVASTDEGTVIRTQAAHSSLNATGELISALIKGGIVLSSTAAAVAGTLPTGAVLDATFAGSDALLVGEGFEWSVINTGAVNAFTVTAAATGHTVAGAGVMVVLALTSARFFTRKTAAETFLTYRLS